MKDEDKTKEQLMGELAELRRRVAQLEAREAERKQAKEEAKEARKYAENLIDSSLDMIIAVDEDRKVIEFNKTAEETFGYSREEILGRHVDVLYDDPEEGLMVHKTTVKTGQFTGEIANRRKSGEAFPSFLSASVLRNAKGRFIGVMGISRDVTERKRAEEELRRCDEKYHTLVENLKQSVLLKDTDSRFVSANSSFCNLLGAKLEDIIGKTDYDFYPRELAEKYRADDRRVIDNGETLELIEEHETRDGRRIWVEVVKTPARDSQGNVTGVLVIFWDITERKRMEDELKDSVERLEILFECAPDAYYLNDLEGTFVDGNKAAEEIIGYKRDELIGASFMELKLLPPEQIPKAAENLAKNAMGLPSGPDEFVLNRKDGGQVIVEIRTFPVKIKDQPLVLGIARDITDRKRAEDALAEERNILRTLIDAVPDHIYVKDTESRFVLANTALMRLVGAKTPEEIIGKTDFDFFPRNAAHYYAYEQEMMRSGQPVINKEEFDIDSAGNRSWVLTTKVPLRDSNGKIIGLVGTNRDITDRKLAEEALVAEKELLAVTLRSIGDGVITTDLEGKVVLINKVAEKLTGWTQEEAVFKPLDEVFHIINEDTRVRCENPVERVLESGVIVGLANRTVLVAKDGTERIIADSGSPICNKNGNVLGVVLVFRDITEKRRMEGEFQKIAKLESLGTLAGGIAHDFNNILTAILGNVSLARMYADTGTTGKVIERLTEAERASMQAKDLTQRLLTFSRGGAPIKKVVSIAELLRNSTSLALCGSNVRCEFSVPDNLWSAEVDEGQMSQVINNIVINAAQAMPGGGVIKVRARNATVKAEDALPLKDGAYVRVSIADQGIGIPREHLRKIFDPYFTTKQRGSGLGLATSYSIIRNHSGHIAVESQLGVGSAFHIYLPASPEKVPPVAEEAEETPIMGEGRILVMDDEKYVRDTLAGMLSSIGYKVTTSIDVAEAVEMYREAIESGQPYDAVILDLTVPGGMGGRETIQRLLEIDPEVKAIVSSGYSNDPIMADFRRYGFKGVMAKPYKIRELSEVLHRVISS